VATQRRHVHQIRYKSRIRYNTRLSQIHYISVLIHTKLVLTIQYKIYAALLWQHGDVTYIKFPINHEFAIIRDYRKYIILVY